jgi:hypothetical protein
VLQRAVEWGLDQDLVEAIRDVGFNDEPGEGPLVEQYENASRLHDDDWLEAAYEGSISGWGDDF